MKRIIAIALLLPAMLLAQEGGAQEVVGPKRHVVQVDDNGNTIPPNSVATPQQITQLDGRATSTHTTATNLLERVKACEASVKNLSTNIVVTSTVYVQSVGGIPYDPGNQTLRIHSIDINKTTGDITLVGSVAQAPLIAPVVDWRVSLAGAPNEWSVIQATVEEIPIGDLTVPEGETIAKAYSFTFPKPPESSSFFRIVDNSTGASGSGLYWLVYGGIYVDGKKGYTGIVNGHKFVGGILVEDESLGAFGGSET